MKIIINYDFFEAIKNVNENFSSLKIIRNEKYKCLSFSLPLYFVINYFFHYPKINSLMVFPLCFSINIVNEYIKYYQNHEDKYKVKAKENLELLAEEFQKFNLKTDYDLLLKSKLYEKHLNIKLNVNNLPVLLESKYILVPTYTGNHSSINSIPILEEHIMGSKEYVLSIGKPVKELKLVYVNDLSF